MFWGSAILCCALSFGFVACSDDDDKDFSIEETFKTDGIKTDFEGGIYKIKVIGNSDWTASVPKNGKWVNVVVNEGKGGEEVVILVEPKYDGISRNTTLTIQSGGDKFDIAINQEVGKSNAQEGFDYVSSKALGFGYDVSKYQRYNKSIFNVKAVDAVKQTDEIMYASLISDNPVNVTEWKDLSCDSVENKSDSLSVRMSCNISYATFKLNLTGALSSTEVLNTDSKVVHLGANYPVYEASINTSAILNAYNEWKSEGSPKYIDKEKKIVDYRGCMIQSTFMEAVKDLEEAVKESGAKSYKDDEDVEDCCSELLSLAGPVVVTKAVIGGNYSLSFRMDTTYTNQVFRLDSAKVTTDIKAGLFSLEGEVEAKYSKTMEQWLKHCNYDATVRGGKLVDREAIYTMFKTADRFDNRTAINTWTQNIKLSNNMSEHNAELIEVELEGVWNFLDRKSKKIMREYIGDIPQLKNSEIISRLLKGEDARVDLQ